LENNSIFEGSKRTEKELHYRAKTEVIFVVRHVPKYKNKYHPNSPGAVNTKLRDNFIFSSSKPHPGPLY